MPRITAMTFTPAFDAWYNASISATSVRLFIFSQIVAGLPARAKSISLWISASSLVRVVSGLNPSSSMVSGRA